MRHPRRTHKKQPRNKIHRLISDRKKIKKAGRRGASITYYAKRGLLSREELEALKLTLDRAA